MNPRTRIYLRHFGLTSARPTDIAEWLRMTILVARRRHPHLFTKHGAIIDQSRFTAWLAEAYPPKETA